jgi:hypothetical protein
VFLSLSRAHNIILLVYRARTAYFIKGNGEKWMSKVFSSFLCQFYEQTVARLLFFSSLGGGECRAKE